MTKTKRLENLSELGLKVGLKYIDHIYNNNAELAVQDLSRWPAAFAALVTSIISQSWDENNQEQKNAFDVALLKASLNAYPEPEDLQCNTKSDKPATTAVELF
jgi:hypothetical protein